VLEQRFDSLQRFKSRQGGLKGIEGVKEPVARRQGDLVNEILRRRDGTPGEGRDPTRERVDTAPIVKPGLRRSPEPLLRSASSC
jgi:hypothetical protein